MDETELNLSKYRLLRAEEALSEAEYNLAGEKFRVSLNRSYYAVFYAMRAVNALDGFDSKKHSGVRSHFRQQYLKTGKLDKGLSDIIKETIEYREKADYDDFYVVSVSDAKEQLQNTKKFVQEIKAFLELQNAEKNRSGRQGI